MYGDFLNLNAIIKGGPNLRTLVLNRCDIHVDPLPWDFKNFNLTSFKFVGGKVTSMALLVSLIRTTMPKLVGRESYYPHFVMTLPTCSISKSGI